MKYFIIALKKSFVFKGRATVQEYWSFKLLSILVMFIPLSLLFTTYMSAYIALYMAVIFAIILINAEVSLTIRRFHDLNLSAFWLLLLFAPSIIIALIVYISFNSTGEELIRSKIQDIYAPFYKYWGIIAFLSVINLVFMIILGLLLLRKGKSQDNRFGKNPY